LDETVEVKLAIAKDCRFSIGEIGHSITYFTLYQLQQRNKLVPLSEIIHKFKPKENHPLLYHFTCFDARIQTIEKIAHAFPSKLVRVNKQFILKKNNSKLKEEVICDNLIGICFWKTRCVSPRVDLLVYCTTNQTIYLVNDCIAMLKAFKCDLDSPLDDNDIETMYR
jgi:hypothetical protein